MTIKDVRFTKILNSNGNWTLECFLETQEGIKTISSVPEGESKGVSEAYYLNVDLVLKNFPQLKQKLINKDFNSLLEFDNFLCSLDGTENKKNLGANTILCLSICFAKAMAQKNEISLYQFIHNLIDNKSPLALPKLIVLMFEGGKHGMGNITIQEFLIICQNVNEGVLNYKIIKDYLSKNNYNTSVGLEGAFSPQGLDDLSLLEILSKSIKECQIALDVAETSREGRPLNYKNLLKEYHIKSVEDPCKENDWEGWKNFYQSFGKDVLVVADDLTVTNVKYIKKVIKEKVASAVVIKPNQIGTLSESLEAVKLCKDNGLKTVVSHRGGETNEDYIADFAVGVNADYVKFGGFSRGERIAKYNRLLAIGLDI